MNAAASVDAPHGLSLPPALHRLRPLLGQVVLRERLQRAHDLAIDDPGGEGIELTGDRRDGRFVEEAQPPRDIAFEDQAAGLGDTTEGGGGRSAPVPVSMARRAHCRALRSRPTAAARSCGPPPARRERASRPGPPGAAPPASPSRARGHEGRVEEQVHGDPDRRARRRETIARAQALRVGPLPRRDRHVEMTGGVRHVGEKGEVRPLQRVDRASASTSSVVGLLPVPRAEASRAPCKSSRPTVRRL